MALTRTTLSSACAANDTSIVVASATGFAADQYVRIDQEWMVVQKSYTSGTTIPVRRGQMGSPTSAHVVTSGVETGVTSSDFPAKPGPGAKTFSPVAGRSRWIESITADNSTVAHTYPGTDHIVILNGTSVINLTVPVPTVDMDGDFLYIAGNGAAAHVITFTGGLSGAGTSYDVVTVNASAPVVLCAMAINGKWNSIVATPMAGTVTNITGTVA